MRTAPECLPCFLKQAMLTAQRGTDDPDLIFSAVQEAAKHLPHVSPDDTPPENARPLFEAVTGFLGVENPYAEEKAHYNALALRAYDALRAFVQESPDPLRAAVRVAAVGNIMDLVYFDRVDVNDAVKAAQTTELAVNHLERLRRDVAAAGRILYLGDNAGEIVFDLPLVELLADAGKEVTFGVKTGAAANDVTRDDALQVGMDRFARIVETGCPYLGAPLKRVSPAFRAAFDAAQVIVAKGQANFETLSDVEATLYFIVKAKCAPAARALGVRQGDMVLLARGGQ